MPIYEIETDQGIFEIDANREPTQEEALAAISSQSAPSASNRVPQTPGMGVMAGDSLLKDVGEAIPFSNAPSEFREGQRSGEQIFGDNLAGKLTGLLLGSGRAGATALNPIGKIIGAVPKYTQAAGSALGGDLNAALRDITGSNLVSSAAEIPEARTGNINLDTFINGLTGTANEAVVKQPLSLLGLTPEALAQQGTAIKNFPSNISKVAKGGVNAIKGVTPVDAAQVQRLQRNVDDLQQKYDRFKGAQTADALKAQQDLEIAKQELAKENDLKNAQELTLEQKLQQLQTERDATRKAALSANTGTDLNTLINSSGEAVEGAGALRSELPSSQGPQALGRSINEAITGEISKSKPQETENYQAVRESLPESQPEMEASNLHNAATSLSREESAGLQSLGDKRINSVLNEASKVRTSENLSPEARQIYDALPDSQKAAFLEQMPGGLTSVERPTYTWDDLQKTYQRLNGKISDAVRNQDGNAVQVLSILKDAVSKDMSTYAESIGTDTKSLFDQANSEFAANRQKFGNSRIAPLVTDLASATPETIVGKITGKGKASIIDNLREILPPEKFQEVQAQFADDLFSPSKDIPFDPEYFVKRFNDIDNETLKAVFGEEGLARLAKIKELSQGANELKAKQATIDEFNNAAQKAEDAYQNAKSAADQKRILDGVKSDAQKAVDEAQKRIDEIDREQNTQESHDRHARLQRDIEDAKQALKEASNPKRVSLAVRALYGAASFGGMAISGHAALAPAAGALAFAFGRMVHRDLATPLVRSLSKKK